MTGISTPNDPVPAPPGWLAALAVCLVMAGSAIVVAAPTAVARRLTVASLPAGADLTYARHLLLYLGIVLAAATIALALWWGLARRFRNKDLGHWLLAVSIGLFLAAALSMWWYVDDDAGISFTFARNLAEGHGLIFNPGEQPVEGYSNPLWVFILAGARLVHLDIVITAKTLGLVFGALCILLVWRAVRNEQPVAWLALPLAALNASAVVWTSSGLENALHALLLTAVIALVSTAEGRSRTPWLLVFVLALLVISRPEGVVFALIIAVWLAYRARSRDHSLNSALVVLIAPLVVLGAMMVFRQAYFGDMLPNTFYAKASSTNPLRLLNPGSGGWSYVAEAVSGCGWTIGLLPILIVLALPRRWPAVVPATLLVITAQLFFVVSVGGDWMKEFRFIAPIVPAASILIGIGLARIRVLLAAAGVTAWRGAGVCGLLAACIIYPQIQRLIIFAHNPTTPLSTVAKIGEYFKELGREAGLEDPTLLDHDAGGTSFVARIHLIDLAGLCDPVIGRHWRDRERMRRYIFEERRPDFIYSGPHFARRIGLEQFPEFETDYVPLPPAPSSELDGYIRRVRRDLYPEIFKASAPPALGRP